ncbi:MAG: DDE-type integrase/transposase/recombinase, partial [Deltaproteobacteria bacterium]|nr:DDE-type integrase/transposase/recombinase [Deltaproteobacteria bacterium]
MRCRQKVLAQCHRREREHHARRDAAQCAEQLGTTRASAALGVSARTLRHWRHEQQTQEQSLSPRGRVPTRCDIELRNQVVRFLHHVTGPSVALSALRCLFPKVPRCVLANLLTRYRRVWRRRYAPWGFRLTWHHAGRVWAMDHSEAPQPVDGIYPYLFAVRDLASHHQIAWHPVRTVTAEETEPILNELFSQHGAPLVLKSDNGSAFIAADLRKSVHGEGTAQLFSPPRRPSYNGALERSNSTMKKYTHQHAANDGHPLRWTSADLEHSRQLANAISRPWGHHGRTPDEVWQARESISVEERAKFQAELTKQRALALDDLGLANVEQPLSFADQARCDRLAMRRALEELGYLTLERKRCPSKKPKRKSREKLKAALRKMTNESDPIETLASRGQCAHGHASDDQRLAMLAPADRIQADDAQTSGHIEPHHASQQIPPARREWA